MQNCRAFKPKPKTRPPTLAGFVGVCLFWLFLYFPALSQPLSGRVVAIADGDTLTILDDEKTQHKIRLAGIDAPEKGQPFSQKAKENLSRLVFGQVVTIEGEKRDRYGRRVAKVLLHEVDAGLELVKLGLAWHFKRYQREQNQSDRKSYAEAEEKARAERLGLWADPNPVDPSEWRARKRKPAPLIQLAQFPALVLLFFGTLHKSARQVFAPLRYAPTASRCYAPSGDCPTCSAKATYKRTRASSLLSI